MLQGHCESADMKIDCFLQAPYISVKKIIV